MVFGRRFDLSDLDIEGELEFTDDAHVSLDYQNAPTLYEIEQEIVNGLSSCFYNTESTYETVKSRKDITLEQFGLVYVCDICGEEMDSYNKAALIRHMRKHETENQVFAAGPKGGRKNFDYPDGTWFTKDGSPKPSLPAVCEMCGSLRGGHLTYPCLHNNKMSWLCNLCYLKTLGYVKAAESWEISQFDKPDFSGYTGEINVKGNTIAPAGTIVYRSMLVPNLLVIGKSMIIPFLLLSAPHPQDTKVHKVIQKKWTITSMQ